MKEMQFTAMVLMMILAATLAWLLSAWLKTTPEQLFKPWLTRLRIDEAKRQLHQHPDWQLESIARHCGFKTANYFHEVFKKQIGLTPTEWLSQG